MSQRKIEIILAAKNAMKAGLDGARGMLSSFGSSIKSVFSVVGNSIKRIGIGAMEQIGRSIPNTISKMIGAYAQQEQAEKGLAAALRSHGEAVDELMPKLQELAAEIQNETGVADEANLATMERLRMLGVQTGLLGEATKATIALKEAGLDGEQAAKAIAMAYEGNYTALTRYIPAVRTAVTEEEKAAALNEFLSKAYDVQKDKLNTLGGAWDALKGRVVDMWEEFGRGISQSGEVKEMLQMLGDKVKAFGERVREWIDSGGLADVMAKVKEKIDSVREAFRALVEAKYDIAAALITAAFAAMILKINAASGAIGVWAAAMVAKLGIVNGAVLATNAKVLLLKGSLMALNGIAFVALLAGIYSVGKAAMDAMGAINKLLEAQGRLKDVDDLSVERYGVRGETLSKIKKAINEGDFRTLAKLRRLYPEAVEKIQSAMEQWGDSAKDAGTASQQAAVVASSAYDSIGQAAKQTAFTIAGAAREKAAAESDAVDEIVEDNASAAEQVKNIQREVTGVWKEELSKREEAENESLGRIVESHNIATGMKIIAAQAATGASASALRTGQYGAGHKMTGQGITSGGTVTSSILPGGQVVGTSQTYIPGVTGGNSQDIFFSMDQTLKKIREDQQSLLRMS